MEIFMATRQELQAYWKTNLRYILLLLGVWFFVSYFCGIIAVDTLDQIRFGGFKLGFWFANQGSEIIFCLLIVIYVRLMNSLDKKYGVAED
jgi:putative solute:sodium symporter small subunit